MEQYKKMQIRFIIKLGLGGVAFLGIYLFFYQFTLISNIRPSAMMYGGAVGILVGYGAVFVGYLVRTVQAFKNPERMEKLYVGQCDERNLLIGQKTGGTASQIIMVLLLAATMIAGVYNVTVCYTLYLALCVVLIVYFSCYVYYKMKY